MITRRHTIAAQALLALLLILGAARLATPGARAQGPAAQPAAASVVYLPLVGVPPGRPAPAPAPAPAPPQGSLPGQLVGTWYSGQLLNLTLYDPVTGMWSDAGGLGHMYVFRADGTYTLVSFLKLGEGTTCVSTVAKYEAGAASAPGDTLQLTPNVSRTRTKICGSTPATEVEGPHATYSLPWEVGEDANSHTKLWLQEAQGATEYYKDGLGPQVVGDWANGDGGAIWLYDPASGQWADPTGARSEWYAFSPDGTFRHGIVDPGYGDDPCRVVIMSYEEGALNGRGGDLMLKTTRALRRSVSLCDPSQDSTQERPAGVYERWTWAIPAASEGAIMDLLRIEGGFNSIRLYRFE